MNKKILLSFFVLLLGVFGLFNSSVGYANATQTPVVMNVNGQFIQLDVPPVFDESHLLIPISGLASMGLTFEWDATSLSAIIHNHVEGSSLVVQQDSRVALKDGTSIEMTIAAQNRNGRILVPVRFVTEAFGYHVQYETVRKMVFIKSPDYTFDPAILEQEDLQAARKAAISLPITSEFKQLGMSVLPYHGYVFLSGRADKYRFSDRHTISHVEIINGEAKLTAQYVTGHPNVLKHKVGNVEYYSDDVMKEYYGPPFGNPVSFADLGDGTSITGYYVEEEDREFITPISVYSDIIQKIPGNK